MENLLKGSTEQSLESAQLVYTDGGNSKTVATLEIPGGLPINVASGTKLSAKGIDGRDVIGEANAAASASATTIEFKYPVANVGDDHLDCRQGGLPDNERIEDGCKYLSISLSDKSCRWRWEPSSSLCLLFDFQAWSPMAPSLSAKPPRPLPTNTTSKPIITTAERWQDSQDRPTLVCALVMTSLLPTLWISKSSLTTMAATTTPTRSSLLLSMEPTPTLSMVISTCKPLIVVLTRESVSI